MNQKILMRMLKRLGVREVEVVENGKLAVEREAEKAFDIVLMVRIVFAFSCFGGVLEYVSLLMLLL